MPLEAKIAQLEMSTAENLQNWNNPFFDGVDMTHQNSTVKILVDVVIPAAPLECFNSTRFQQAKGMAELLVLTYIDYKNDKDTLQCFVNLIAIQTCRIGRCKSNCIGGLNYIEVEQI